MRYYICPECGEMVTDEDILRDCESGGVGLCGCDYMAYEWNPNIGCLDVIFPRVYHDYKEVSLETFVRLREIQNDAVRLKAFAAIPPECRV